LTFVPASWPQTRHCTCVVLQGCSAASLSYAPERYVASNANRENHKSVWLASKCYFFRSFPFKCHWLFQIHADLANLCNLLIYSSRLLSFAWTQLKILVLAITCFLSRIPFIHFAVFRRTRTCTCYTTLLLRFCSNVCRTNSRHQGRSFITHICWNAFNITLRLFTGQTQKAHIPNFQKPDLYVRRYINVSGRTVFKLDASDSLKRY